VPDIIISPYLKRPLRSLEEATAAAAPAQPEPRKSASAEVAPVRTADTSQSEPGIAPAPRLYPLLT
jgi:hypothetical protein